MRLLALSILAISTPASANTYFHLAASHEWGVPMNRGGAPLGPGVAAHLGPSFKLDIVRLIPEIGASYYYNTEVLVPRAGGRLILAWIVSPGIYAHGNAAYGGVFEEPAFGFDGGLSFHVNIPYLRIGGYGGLQVFGGDTGPTIPDQNFIGGVEIALHVGKKAQAEEAPPPPPPVPVPVPVPAPAPAPPPAPVQ